MLKLLQKRGATLTNPESVFHIINKAKKFSHKTRTVTEKNWTDGAKKNSAIAYKSFCQICNIQISEQINFETWGKNKKNYRGYHKQKKSRH